MGSFGEMETENATGTVSSTRKILPLPPSAADLLCAAAPEKKLYWDRSHYDSPESQMKALCKSSTLYVGNLAFSTRSPHLNALFSTLGPVKEVNIGLDRFKKTACGFAFVEYVHRKDALDAVAYLSGTKLDGRVIRVELDAGFKPGREFGRGISGGQVRDDRRTTVDPARVGGRNNRNFRWQAPQKNNNDESQPQVGQKRGREDDENNDYVTEPSSKNPRFREEDASDDDL